MKKITITLLFSLFFIKIATAQKPTKSGNHTQYITKTNDTIKTGDTITLGLPNNGNQYLFITQGNTPAAAHISGDQVKITKLKSVGTKKRGYKMYAIFKGYGLPVYIQIDQAIKTEEIEL